MTLPMSVSRRSTNNMAGSTNIVQDKLSIKSMLFTRAIPNYVIPVPTEGHKIYSCTDCGDRFLLKSSYEFHINRQSVKITYMCRYCHNVKIFKNRCNLLSHIRGHAFKTATINVSDLKVEPLPVSLSKSQSIMKQDCKRKNKGTVNCYECKADITITGVLCIDRASHYMRYTTEIHSCPVCLFVMPSKCALDAHLRIHLKIAPCCCPECGIFLTTKSMEYPFNHNSTRKCEGFNMMRATARMVCPMKTCNNCFHPSQYVEHLQIHLVKVYRCACCMSVFFEKDAIESHLLTHRLLPQSSKNHFTVCYSCEICSGHLVFQNQLDLHLRSHANTYVYPCWKCSDTFPNIDQLLGHIEYEDCQKKKANKDNDINTNKPTSATASNTNNDTLFRVVKRCDQCKLVFTYRCRHEEISSLPNECPKKCSPGNHVMEVSRTQQGPGENRENMITCYLCKNKMSMDWHDIKIHFDKHHKEYRCSDVKVMLNKRDVTNYYQKKKKSVKEIGVLKKKLRRRNRCHEDKPKNDTNSTVGVVVMELGAEAKRGFKCNKCNEGFNSKQALEEHIVTHRDPCTAYQCLECGECFVGKPSFSTHLLLKHNISGVDEYVANKACYNENALAKHHDTATSEEPLRENQCNICRDQFENLDDLEKHYRVHGMAFLMKKTLNKNASPEK